MVRYYSTQRPVAPGTFPNHKDNRVQAIENFDDRKYCPEAGQEAWGWLEFENPLSRKDTEDYELVEAIEAQTR